MPHRRDYDWFLHLLGLGISGILIGIYWQKMADSGEANLRKIMITSSISTLSYVVSFLLIDRLRRPSKPYYWLFAAALGSALCSVNLRIIKFLIDNWRYRESDSILSYVGASLAYTGASSVLNAAVFIVVALIITSGILISGRQLHRFR
jgi:hypothetical protein